MAVSFYFDPFAVLFRIFAALWPDKEAIVDLGVEIADDDGATRDCFGCTSFPEDGSAPRIAIAGHTPVEHCVEILAHELAHVAVGAEYEHGPQWRAAFDRIHEWYCAEVAALQASADDAQAAED